MGKRRLKGDVSSDEDAVPPESATSSGFLCGKKGGKRKVLLGNRAPLLKALLKRNDQ